MLANSNVCSKIHYEYKNHVKHFRCFPHLPNFGAKVSDVFWGCQSFSTDFLNEFENC